MLIICTVLYVDQLWAQHSLIFYLPYNTNYFQWEFTTLAMTQTLKLVDDFKKM